MLNRVVARMQHGLLSAAFTAWCNRVADQRQLRSAAQKVLWRLRNLALASAFDAWRSR
eukprot:SAG25_NODE_12848_length_274_cov_0.891429_1_plen_57_part_10